MLVSRRIVVGWALGAVLGTSSLSAAEAPTVVLVVRHAEKASAAADDPPLSEAGQARAQALAHVAGAAGVKAVYVTQYKRTRDTAAPLAARLGLTPIEHPAKDTAGLVSALRSKHRGETVLVSGHSNTVNEIVTALTGSALDDLPDAEFDNLFVVVVPPTGPGSVTRLKYGARTP